MIHSESYTILVHDLYVLGEDDNQLYVNYTPTRPGVYNIVVFYDNIQIDGSPFKVTVDVDG